MKGDVLISSEKLFIPIELLNEYYTKKQLRYQLDEECNCLSLKIKRILQEANRKQIIIAGYNIKLETKFEPCEEFYTLLEKNDLGYLITKSITGNHMKSAIRQLELSDKKLQSLLVEKKTKWLYVTR